MENGVDMKEVTARASEFYKRYSGFGNEVAKFMKEYAELKENVISLCNLREHLRYEVRKCEIEKAGVEKQAQMRLENVQKGQKVLIDRLSKKELELANKLKDVETREAIVTEKNREVELLKAELERRISTMTEIETAKRAKVK